MLVGGCAIGGAILVRTLGSPLLEGIGRRSGPDDRQLAAEVGGRIPAIGYGLSNLLDLAVALDRGGGYDGASPELLGAAVERQAPGILAVDWRPAIEQSKRRPLLLLLLASLLLVAGLTLSSGSLLEAWGRIADPATEYAPPIPFTLRIAPGDTTIARGEPLSVVVDVDGVVPDELSIVVREEGSDGERSIAMRSDVGPGGENRFMAQIPNLEHPVTWLVEADRFRSAIHTVDVIDPLLLDDLSVTVEPPPYTGLPRETGPPGIGHIAAPRGSRILLQAGLSEPVASARVVRIERRSPLLTRLAGGAEHDTVITPLAVEGRRIFGGFSVSRDGTWRIEAVGLDGTRQGDIVPWHLDVIADRAPTIELLQPVRTVEIDASRLVPIRVAVADDYGIASLRIGYRLARSLRTEPWRSPKYFRFPRPAGAPLQGDLPALWDLSTYDFGPGDVVEFFVEARDNDRVLGAKSARTRTIAIRYPGGEELRREAERMRGDASDALAALLEEAERTRGRMERLDRRLADLLADRKSRPEAEREIARVVAEHERTQRQLEAIADDLKMMAERRREAAAISRETLDELRELRAMVAELDDPALRRQFEALGRGMQDLDSEELLEAMRKLEFDEEEFRRTLARARAMLERMKDGKGTSPQDERRRRAQLKEAQEDIGLFLDRQKEIAAETRRLFDKGEPDPTEIRDHAREQDELRRDLARMTDRVTDPDHPVSTTAPEAAADLAEAVEAMQKATRSIAGGEEQTSISQQARAMAALEGAAASVEKGGRGAEGGGEDPDGAGGSGSEGVDGSGGESLRSRLQRLAALQQLLNMATGADGGGGQGSTAVSSSGQGSGKPTGIGDSGPSDGQASGKDGGDQGAPKQGVDERQRELVRSLQALEAEARSIGGSRRATADDLAAAIGEIDRLLERMASGRVDDETRRRQDRILSRLLDAVESTYERSEEERRESRPGLDRTRPAPDDLPPGTLPAPESDPRSAGGRTGGYSPEYHRLIQRFLDRRRDRR